MDEFLHDDGFSDTRTSEETYFPSLQHRTDKINDLDTRFENFCLRREIFEVWRLSVDWISLYCLRSFHVVDRITEVGAVKKRLTTVYDMQYARSQSKGTGAWIFYRED